MPMNGGYDPYIRINKEKMAYAMRLYGQKTAFRYQDKGKTQAMYSTLRRMAERFGCHITEFIDLDWYEEHEGGPTWVYDLLLAGRGGDTVRFDSRGFKRNLRRLVDYNREHGIDSSEMFRLIAGHTSQDDYGVKNQVLAKWASRDGAGAVLYQGLVAMLNAPRQDMAEVIKRVGEAMTDEWTRFKKTDSRNKHEFEA